MTGIDTALVRQLGRKRRWIRLDTAGDRMAARRRASCSRRATRWTSFAKPDFKRTSELLKADGITLDAVSASCARHVMAEMEKTADEGL
ncbi:hypothetical protein [Bradyrhizobium cenepequi]|uniref:hypothetical protein n=1 Tax=Bradyrhizobium cenepequi TaxID=2821403 RepID=UPI001CE30C0A|nr:hypothetical protein [Bradyrhizobium cenepequi]MCA6110880.1 hypothetical protein [Bradyrhizobium cenepequi]